MKLIEGWKPSKLNPLNFSWNQLWFANYQIINFFREIDEKLWKLHFSNFSWNDWFAKLLKYVALFALFTWNHIRNRQSWFHCVPYFNSWSDHLWLRQACGHIWSTSLKMFDFLKWMIAKRKCDVHYANYIIDTLIPYRCATPLSIAALPRHKRGNNKHKKSIRAIYLVDLLQLGVFVTIVRYK